MKNIQFLTGTFIALCIIVLASSCEKEVEFSQEDTSTFTSDGYVETAFSSVENILNEGMNYVEENGMGRVAANPSILDCATLTLGGTKSSGALEIDFGDGCLAIDGRTWKGIIKLSYSGRRYEAGSIVNTTFTNFFIDEYKIEGNVKSTTISANLQQAVFSVNVAGGKLVYPDGAIATWNANRMHTWSIQENGLMLSVEGTANGSNTMGIEYTTEITQPLIFKSECISSSTFIAIQGRKSISVGEKLDILMDYGQGTCDRMVTITVGRQTKEVNF